MEPSILSLIPPVVTIGLAVTTKRIFLSLGAGIAVGALLLAEWSIGDAISSTLDIVSGLIYAEGEVTEEVYILVFILLLGSLTCLVRMLGGALAFSEWAAKWVRTRLQAQLATLVFGIIIFFDDAFSSLVRGNVSRPLFDKYRISRAKLSYLVGSTAAPVIISTPISGWAAFIAALMGSLLAQNEIAQYSGYEAYLLTIPTNFYAITAIVFAFAVAIFALDFGPMRQHEKRAVEQGIMFDDSKGPVPGETDAEVPPRSDGRVADLLVPVLTLVVVTLGLAAWIGISAGAATFTEVLEETNMILALAIGGLAACVVALGRAVRKRATSRDMGKATYVGARSMLPAAVVLFLAWITAELISELGVGEYLATFVQGGLAVALLPLLFFLLSAMLGFSIGSTFGTFGLMLPIAAEIAASTDVSMLIPVFGACLGGAIFGDHMSPLSDTTILSAVGSGIYLVDHVNTQLPYGVLGAVACAVGYVALGLTGSTVVGLLTLLAALAAIVVVLRARYSRLSVPAEQPAEPQPAQPA